MPRKPGVYRKMKVNKVTALCVNLRNGTTFTDIFSTPYFKDKVSCLKYLEKNYNNDNMRVVKIKKMVDVEVKYFLSIENYLKYAVEESEVKNNGR